MLLDTELKPATAWQVPAYDRHEFHPRRTRYCVGIPVLNEGSRLLNQLDRMAALGAPADILIGDGGSRDGSAAPEPLAQRGVRTLLVKTGPGKLSAQLRMIFAYALEQGYEGIVTLDGNGKDGVEATPSFLDALARGYDFVQGSRWLPGGYEKNTPLDRKLGLKLLHAPLLSLAAGFRYTDTTNGFRAFSRCFLEHPGVQPFRDIFDTYNLHYYLAVRAPRLGFKVTEIPVRRVYPPSGPTPSKIGGVWAKLALIRLLLLTVFGQYNP